MFFKEKGKKFPLDFLRDGLYHLMGVLEIDKIKKKVCDII